MNKLTIFFGSYTGQFFHKSGIIFLKRDNFTSRRFVSENKGDGRITDSPGQYAIESSIKKNYKTFFYHKLPQILVLQGSDLLLLNEVNFNF